MTVRLVNAAWFSVAGVVIVLDQWTKTLAQAHLAERGVVEVTPFFNLILAFNPGAAFSFLGTAGGWQRWFFVAVAVIVSIVLAVWLIRLDERESNWMRLGLSLILGGAIGNLWDRLVLGVVVDFIDLHWANHPWPAFNIADSAIVVGAVLLVWLAFRTSDAPSDRPA